MLLKNLIKISQKEIELIIIKDLSLDSRKVKRGDLFFALKGSKSNGEKFIKQAIVKGAKAVISQRNIKIKTKVPIIKVNNIISKNLTWSMEWIDGDDDENINMTAIKYNYVLIRILVPSKGK